MPALAEEELGVEGYYELVAVGLTSFCRNSPVSKEALVCKRIRRCDAAMVLWELTLATAYVLGLPRTYRLALRLQRRLISPKYPKLRGFVYRYGRLRAVSLFSLRLRLPDPALGLSL